MKSAKLFLGMLLLMSLCLVMSCGEDGDAGPAGEKGDKGDTGEPGPAGQDGAGVIYSPWLNLDFVSNDGLYTAVVDVPQLTNEIATTGDVRVYLNILTADEPVIAPLPYFEDFDYYVRYIAYPNGITIGANFDASTGTGGNPNFQYRYVLIPGSEAAGRKTKNIDWSNYAEVKAYLKLAD